MSAEIRIYVADLAAYNAGVLHGVWINATDPVRSIHEQIHAMLAESPQPDAEDFAIHDFEGFEGYAVGEYEAIDKI